MKKKIFIISLVMLIVTLGVIKGSYALFETNTSSENELEIGKWEILVNDNDVSLTDTIAITDFVLSASSHTADNYFAPGRTATFDVEIDASESDVSVSYELEFDDSALEDHPNITVSITNLNTNEVINSNTYSGEILLTDQSRVLTLQIALTWANVAQYDENDTELIGEDLSFDITAHFEQYLGE